MVAISRVTLFGVLGLTACVVALGMIVTSFFLHHDLLAPTAGFAMLGWSLGLASRGSLRVISVAVGSVTFFLCATWVLFTLILALVSPD